MTLWLQRSVRMFGIIGLIACSGLAASATNHIIDARLLEDSPVWKATGPRPRPGKAPVVQAGSKDGDPLIERNMFCSMCTPAEPGPDPTPLPSDGVPLSALPLVLIATNLAQAADASFATIIHPPSSRQGSFFVGDVLPDAGPIERIEGTTVVFHNPAANRLERISLTTVAAREAIGQRSRAPGSGAGKVRADSPFAESIVKVNDTTYEVERQLVDKLLSNPTQLGARVRPVAGDDGRVGMQLAGVRASSAIAAIGLHSGDTIEAINGMAMTTDPDKLLEMYGKLSQAPNLSVSVRDRQGRASTLDYRIR
jgi:type II secretory pathway component PulC